ncbi:hypothetical protein AYI70_g4872 [Smittium culicis]|uniref:Uncharacterized protein n=1 Tax=Smittium culicis TaxID=133412 RepID=A0A1R1XWZ7_9FUNG|nr:hypothetical protein AYI70_g4872 [Smittium culicis]
MRYVPRMASLSKNFSTTIPGSNSSTQIGDHRYKNLNTEYIPKYFPRPHKSKKFNIENSNRQIQDTNKNAMKNISHEYIPDPRINLSSTVIYIDIDINKELEPSSVIKNLILSRKKSRELIIPDNSNKVNSHIVKINKLEKLIQDCHGNDIRHLSRSVNIKERDQSANDSGVEFEDEFELEQRLLTDIPVAGSSKLPLSLIHKRNADINYISNIDVPILKKKKNSSLSSPLSLIKKHLYSFYQYSLYGPETNRNHDLIPKSKISSPIIIPKCMEESSKVNDTSKVSDVKINSKKFCWDDINDIQFYDQDYLQSSTKKSPRDSHKAINIDSTFYSNATSDIVHTKELKVDEFKHSNSMLIGKRAMNPSEMLKKLSKDPFRINPIINSKNSTDQFLDSSLRNRKTFDQKSKFNGNTSKPKDCINSPRLVNSKIDSLFNRELFQIKENLVKKKYGQLSIVTSTNISSNSIRKITKIAEVKTFSAGNLENKAIFCSAIRKNSTPRKAFSFTGHPINQTNISIRKRS